MNEFEFAKTYTRRAESSIGFAVSRWAWRTIGGVCVCVLVERRRKRKRKIINNESFYTRIPKKYYWVSFEDLNEHDREGEREKKRREEN